MDLMELRRGLLMQMAVSSGLRYAVDSVTATNNTPEVDRHFTDFIFIAQVDSEELENPTLYYAYFMMFVYVNGKMVVTSTYKGFSVTSQSNNTWSGGQSSLSQTQVSETKIKFSAYTSSAMARKKWNVLQVEIPSDFDIYSFADIT